VFLSSYSLYVLTVYSNYIMKTVLHGSETETNLVRFCSNLPAVLTVAEMVLLYLFLVLSSFLQFSSRFFTSAPLGI
jgi:hypothetical protein